MNAKKWIGKWKSVEPEAAFQEIARRYLRAYGPLTPKHFARWWNEGRVNVAKKVFQQIEDELEPVDVEGWQALALRSTVEPMQQSAVSGVVRLLPLFDAYVLDIGRTGEPILPKPYWKQVFRQGDGRRRLCWSMASSRESGTIRRTRRGPQSRWRCSTHRLSLSSRVSKRNQRGWANFEYRGRVGIRPDQMIVGRAVPDGTYVALAHAPFAVSVADTRLSHPKKRRCR